MKISEMFINIILNIVTVLGIIAVIGLSIPMLIIYATATLIWRVAEFISTITKIVWEWLLDKYNDFLSVVKS